MKRSNFSVHLTELTPDIRKLISFLRRKRFFGIHDANDLFQEVMLTLWMNVPKHYSKKKGKLKPYCMTAAFRCIQRIANKEYKMQYHIPVKWQTEFEHNHGELPEDIHDSLVKIMKVTDERKTILFRVKVDQLLEYNKQYTLIKLLYEHDGNRKVICKMMNRSNACITKMIERLKRRRYELSIPDNIMSAFV